jgi:hypothetical protein
MMSLVGVEVPKLIPHQPIISGRDFLIDKLMMYDGKNENGRLIVTS